MFFKFAPFRGPASWKFKNPENDREFTGRTLQEICAEIRGYRAQNNYENLDYLETIVESYNCTLPDNIGGCEPLPKLKRGVFAYFTGGIALMKKVLYDRMVDQATADKRSEICKDCPNNVFLDRNFFIKWSDDLANASTDGKKSKFHDELGNCQACTCPLRSKVFYAGKIELTDKEKADMLSGNKNCWQVEANVR